MSTEVHPTAIVSESAVIGDETVIGPYSIIGAHVVIGKGNRIGPHAVIDGHTTIGNGNSIFQFSSVGAAPQDLKYHGEPSILTIGDENIIREFVTIQPGTSGGGMKTTIGSKNLFMANCHVGHDAVIGDSNIFANSAALAGHVVVGSGVTVGGLVGVHQFVQLGDLCFLGAGAMVNRDIPPFTMAQGDRAHLFGLNKVGLERRGVSAQGIQSLRTIYRNVFKEQGRVADRVRDLLESSRALPAEAAELAEKFLQFFNQSTRGVCFPRKSREDSDE